LQRHKEKARTIKVAKLGSILLVPFIITIAPIEIRLEPKIDTKEVATGSITKQTKVIKQIIINMRMIFIFKDGRALPISFITPKSYIAPPNVITVATKKKASQEFSFKKVFTSKTRIPGMKSKAQRRTEMIMTLKKENQLERIQRTSIVKAITIVLISLEVIF
jgi:hypothetical protein